LLQETENNSRSESLGTETLRDFAEERADRKAHLAGAYRIFALFGYDHWVAGHITVRDPQHPEQFWVNPFGMSWRQIRSSDLILVSPEGEILEGEGSLNGAAFAIHSAIHRARPDVVAVAHAHTPNGQAWSATGRQLSPVTQDACAFYQDHAVFDEYTGVIYDASEGDRVASVLEGNKALILRHHGLITVGTTVDEAAFWLHLLEKCCGTHLLLSAAAPNEPLPSIGHHDALRAHDQVGQHKHGWLGFQTLWSDLQKNEPDLFE
jgi:ribulose-5-phosphate 4-epimerase/fuculose-1-phosphate aldolase